MSARDSVDDLLAREEALRGALIDRLRTGTITPDELATTATLLGLASDHDYVAVVGAVGNESGIEAALPTGEREALAVVHAVVAGRLLALIPGEVSPNADGSATLGVGRRRPINEAHLSFAEAEQALQTAVAFGISGLVDLEQLAPLTIVTSTAPLAEHTARRRFASLDGLGRTGVDVEQTVVAYLASDRSIDAAASALAVHRNTVRHRLRRFHELTGLDIARTDELVTAWWLLHHRQARRVEAKAGL